MTYEPVGDCPDTTPFSATDLSHRIEAAQASDANEKRTGEAAVICYDSSGSRCNDVRRQLRSYIAVILSS